MKKVRVGVVYGGRSAEHEVSVVSARCVLEAIDRDKYEVVPVAITKQGRWMLPEKAPGELVAPPGRLPDAGEAGAELAITPHAGLQPSAGPAPGAQGPDSTFGQIDVVFPLVHGPYGEDGTLQGLLELAGIPYVGGGVLASALGMDKEMQKRLFEGRGIPLVPWVHLHAGGWARNPAACVDVVVDQIGLPCFTKPARLGSSVGVSKCKTSADVRAGLELAFSHDDKVLVEKAVSARELECGVLGNDEPEASVVGEVLSAHEFYDYDAKYLEQASRTVVPADIPAEIAEEVRRLSIEAFTAIDCRGMARVDFFYEAPAGKVLLNEINTIPGFTPISMYPQLWDATGVPYAKLIDRLIELAQEP